MLRPFHRASFATGTPAKPFGGSGCVVGAHIGRMLDVERFDAAGGPWATQATCSNCRATVERTEFVRAEPPFEPLLFMLGGEG